MEGEPDYKNVVFMDEARRAHWLRELHRARELGTIAVFGHEPDKPADVIPFPRKPDEPPDGAA